jgi:lipoprotein-releasing system ATP-binding protein
LGGLDTPDEGNVFYGNENIFAFTDEKRARFRNYEVGFIFQFHHLLPEFTALENVFLPGLIGKRNSAEIRKNALELLVWSDWVNVYRIFPRNYRVENSKEWQLPVH